jgi:hypothetical protein
MKGFVYSIFRDSIDGSWSSRRIITFLAFVFCSIAFFADLFWSRTINAAMFEGMMYIVLGGLGFTVSEKFASKPTKFFYGTPLPKTKEREI